MKNNRPHVIASLALAVFATAWLVHSPFYSAASTGKKITRGRMVRLAPDRFGDSLLRRDRPQTILPVSAPPSQPVADTTRY